MVRSFHRRRRQECQRVHDHSVWCYHISYHTNISWCPCHRRRQEDQGIEHHGMSYHRIPYHTNTWYIISFSSSSAARMSMYPSSHHVILSYTRSYQQIVMPLSSSNITAEDHGVQHHSVWYIHHIIPLYRYINLFLRIHVPGMYVSSFLGCSARWIPCTWCHKLVCVNLTASNNLTTYCKLDYCTGRVVRVFCSVLWVLSITRSSCQHDDLDFSRVSTTVRARFLVLPYCCVIGVRRDGRFQDQVWRRGRRLRSREHRHLHLEGRRWRTP